MDFYINTRKRKSRRGLKLGALAIFLSLGFAVGYFAGSVNETTVIYQNETRTSNIVTYLPYEMSGEEAELSHSSIVIPAVDEEGQGVSTLLNVQVFTGNGRILTNIDNLLFWLDTQNSIRTASKVAADTVSRELSNYDIVYTLRTNATSVEGSSAGAALTIATIAAFEGEEIRKDVMITGVINHDGTIGPVGEILSKAMVAERTGAKRFLVPLAQSQEITYEERRYCEKIGPAEICTREQIPKKIDIGEEAGIEVIEVRTIEEALEYFFPLE